MRKVAVCDIDGTIFRSSLLIELFRKMGEEKFFPSSVKRVDLREYRKWQNREGTYEAYVRKVVELYHSHIKGIALKQVMKVSDRILQIHRQRVYRYTRDKIRQLAKTHFLLAISHSPYFIVKPFCTNMGFDKVYAPLYRVNKQGLFTGEMEHEDLIFSKDKVLERAIEKEHLTLRGSVGIGDTESDIPFLSMVESPIAFNPNYALWKTAKKNKWKVVVERKDMIYEM
jgi:HAD superfamily hydrolase (TIGR01490 family)